MGQVGHALLTRSPLSPTKQAWPDPVRLACVKHAASVHPEPESNPPQKTSWKANKRLSKRKKTDHPCKAKNGHTKKPRHPSNPLGYHTGGHRTGNQEPQATPTRMRPMASSTVHTIEFSNHQTHPQPRPSQEPAAVSGSKRKTYTNPHHNTTHRRVAHHPTPPKPNNHNTPTGMSHQSQTHNHNPQSRPTHFFPTSASSVVSLYIGRP